MILEPKKWKQYISNSCLNLLWQFSAVTNWEQLPHQQHPQRSRYKNTKIEGVFLWLSGELKRRLRTGERVQKQHILIKVGWRMFVCQCCYVIWKDCEALTGIRLKKNQQILSSKMRGKKKAGGLLLNYTPSGKFPSQKCLWQAKEKNFCTSLLANLNCASGKQYIVVLTRWTLGDLNCIKVKMTYEYRRQFEWRETVFY